jgi:hypothetical protein
MLYSERIASNVQIREIIRERGWRKGTPLAKLRRRQGAQLARERAPVAQPLQWPPPFWLCFPCPLHPSWLVSTQVRRLLPHRWPLLRNRCQEYKYTDRVKFNIINLPVPYRLPAHRPMPQSCRGREISTRRVECETWLRGCRGRGKPRGGSAGLGFGGKMLCKEQTNSIDFSCCLFYFKANKKEGQALRAKI